MRPVALSWSTVFLLLLGPSPLLAFTSRTTTNKSSRLRSTTLSPTSPRHKALSSSSSLLSASPDVDTIKPNGSSEATAFASSSSSLWSKQDTAKKAPFPAFRQGLVKAGMIAYILSMCIALPVTLFPQWIAYKLGFITRIQKEKYAVLTAQACARWCLRLFPFMSLQTFPYHDPNPPASIWVCNHCSMLDVFVLLAADKRLRGPTRRPIKIVYWKQLEDNPVTGLMFKQAGFIPVQMAANKAGEANDYDKSSFRQLLKDCKQAFAEGFDVGLLPEGQLNPKPEEGLMPVFSGAFTLARMSKRPVHMLALHGTHHLWHPVDGMTIRGRRVRLRVYPTSFRFKKPEDFVRTFKAIIGEFSTKGQDLPREELDGWLSGEKVAEKSSSSTTTGASSDE